MIPVAEGRPERACGSGPSGAGPGWSLRSARAMGTTTVRDPATGRERATPALGDLSPEQLAVRAQGGSTACFAELVTRFEGRLFNFLLRRTGRRADAEDLTQEAFARAFERLAAYDPRWRFSTWLFTIATRMAVSEHRRVRAARGVRLGDFDAAAEEGADRDGPSESAAAGAALWVVAREALGEEHHLALWLRYAEDMGIAEVALVLGKTKVATRVCLFRARQALAAAYVARGGAVPGGVGSGGAGRDDGAAGTPRIGEGR